MEAAVIGGGLGGCAAAIGLRAVGMDVTVYEAAGSMRREGEGISLFANGIAALAALGIDDLPGQRIEKMTALHHRSGKTLTVLDMAAVERRLGYPYVAVARREILEVLACRLDDGIVYDKRCVGVVAAGRSGAEVRFADGTTAVADLVVAADGNRSVIRASLWPGDPGTFFSTAWQATVDLPADYPSPQQVFLVMGPGTVTGTFPTTGRRIGWFIEDRAARPDVRAATGRDELVERFGRWPGPLPGLLAASAAGGIRTDQVYIRRPPRRWSEGRVVLLGDAAHTLSPSIGQGTNQAFADAVALAASVSECGSLDQVGAAYTRRRHLRASLYWQMARAAMAPRLWRVAELNQRLTPDRLGTASWARLTRPDPVVRGVLEGGGLRARTTA